MEPFLSMIMLWPCNFAPRGWAFCWGQIMSIAQNSALFSLLGTTYGGDGVTTFALPNLAGRAPIGAGRSTTGSTYVLGQVAGTENVTLTTAQMPMHNHGFSMSVSVSASNAASGGSAPSATDNALGALSDPASGNAVNGYTSSAPNTPLNIGGGAVSGTIAIAGGSQPFSIMQPYLALNYVIALNGIFPSRN